MASSMRSIPRALSSHSSRPIGSSHIQLSSLNRSLIHPTRPLLSSVSRSPISRQSRNSYATVIDAPPRRRAGFFRWTWRVIYISALGATGTFIYHLYDMRHPADQIPQDPSKKNLVILGSGWGAVSLLKKIDTRDFNVTVISPRNFFLFTPLLPSCTTGTVEHRSIMEPLRNILRHKKAQVNYYEAHATKIDADKKTVYISDDSDIKGEVASSEITYDHLVVAVGAENATFGIPGVKEHSCFLKEVGDAQAIRRRVMDCIETAVFKDQSQSEIDRLMHMVVVGGGPTGVEFAAELYDWVNEDLNRWVNSPEMERLKITLVEAMPSMLPMFSKQLIDYTNKQFQEDKIDVRTRVSETPVNRSCRTWRPLFAVHHEMLTSVPTL